MKRSSSDHAGRHSGLYGKKEGKQTMTIGIARIRPRSFTMNYFQASMLILALVTGTALAADKPPPAPRAAKGAINHLELYYLDGVRLVGDDGFRKDHQLAIDVHMPKDGAGQHPCIVTVHGGGFGGGDKNGFCNDFHAQGVKAGFVMVNPNYVLNPKFLPPQVIYDIRDLVRYLRVNANRFKIDPDAIGLVGFSAGGWLISAGWFPNGDYVAASLAGGIPYQDYVAQKRKGLLRGPKNEFDRNSGREELAAFHFLRSPQPHYPDVSASVQALSADFTYYGQIRKTVAELPAFNAWCGLGKDGKPRSQPGFDAKTDTFVSMSQVTPEKYWGKGVHVPKLTTEAMAYDNTTKVELGERILEFFTRQLVSERRCPNPEIQPGMRIIDGPTPVRIVPTSPGIEVYYTTDSSKPTKQSTRYTAPFTVSPGTTVKAIAAKGDLPLSQVVTATFYQGTPPPIVVAPDVEELPPATVGKPYQVEFKASDPDAGYWYLGGEFRNTSDGKGMNGLQIDDKGVLSGTPTSGGRFWLQVQVARERLGIATLRNYRLVIAGPAGDIPEPVTAEDRNIDFARAPADYTREDIDTIIKPIIDSGIDVHVNRTDGGWLLVIDKNAWATAHNMIIWPIRYKKVKPLEFFKPPVGN